MNYRFLCLLLVFFSLSAVFAITSNDAVNYIVSSNNFLFEGETYAPPNVPIEFDGVEYWVIPLTSGSNVITYFPVNVGSGLLETSRGVNRGMFGVADKLRDLQSLKASLSNNSGVDWVFTQKYQTIFNEIGIQINDEVFQLNTVETTLRDEGININPASLKNELRSMASQASDLTQKISTASNAENTFITKPSQENFDVLEASYQDVFDSIAALNDASLDYKSNSDRLKQQISIANLDAQTKSQLFAILEVPQGIQALRNYNLDSTQIMESLNAAFQASDLARDSLLNELDSRVAKNDTHKLLYGDNEKLSKDTPFESLTVAKTNILSEENKASWKNQARVSDFEQNYGRAVKAYNQRNYESASEFAVKAIDDAISVYKAGEKDSLPTPDLLPRDALFQVAGLLVAILILLYIFNNREKLGKKVFGGGEEEVDIYK